MARFITLAGRKQVGKDTSARFIRDLLTVDKRSFGDQLNDVEPPPFEFHQVHIVHFADALKKACHVIFGISLEDMETEEGKRKLTKVHWPEALEIEVKLAGHNDRVLWDPCDQHGFMTIREVLQFVGTDLFRNQMDPDVWLNSVFLKPWKDDDIVIIADARFPNEAALGCENGLLISIERDTGLVSDGHKSESALVDYVDYDYIIDNNGSFDKLRDELDYILNATLLA